MTPSPLGIARQRRQVRALAMRVGHTRREAQRQRAELRAELLRRVTRPGAFVLAFVLGMTVGTLAPRHVKSDRAGAMPQGPLMAPLVRAARLFAIRRLAMLLHD